MMLHTSDHTESVIFLWHEVGFVSVMSAWNTKLHYRLHLKTRQFNYYDYYEF